MATTSIWKVGKRLDKVIKYTTNPEKTEDKNYSESWYRDLHNTVEYIKADFKTEKQFYVTGINCSEDNVLEEMKATKKKFGKERGILAYHAFQSFAEGEVTPEQAHKIGIQLAEELWGDRFQVVISTHLNTDNIHNHFVLNSVSFLDGKRFCNTKKDYALMRKTSDRICEDYGLRVLKQEDKYNKYATSSLYKELMKDSIDYAIENASSYSEFIKILQDLNYTVTNVNNALSIKRKPYKRNTRIERQFGNKYSKEYIYKRILETQPPFPYSPNPYPLINRTYQKYNSIKAHYIPHSNSILSLIFHYENPFNINIPKPSTTRITPELLKEIKQMDEYSNQAKLLAKYKINTEQELLDFKKSAYNKISPLKGKRENLWKKHKRAETDDEKNRIENQIVEISKKITPLAEEIRLCDNIQRRMDKINRLKLHNKIEEDRQKAEHRSKKNNKDQYR